MEKEYKVPVRDQNITPEEAEHETLKQRCERSKLYQPDDLKKRAQKAQTELLEVILQFFKDNPDGCFTGGYIRERFNLIKGLIMVSRTGFYMSLSDREI